MKNNMDEIDKMIKQSLSQEEAAFYNELNEQNAFEMLGGLFYGKNRWFIVVSNIMTLLALGAFVFCLVQFLKVETSQELIKWGAGGFTALLMVSMLKVFMWMQMDKNAIIRELKRLELQIASLSGKIQA